MDGFAKKTYTTSRSLTYTYYDSAIDQPLPAAPPTLLFLHGFPDSAIVWKAVFPHLRSLPHRIIAPHLLGFEESSRPTDPALFNSKATAADLAEILASEGVSKIVVIGHDAGSFMAQRLWLWQPQLIVGVVLLNVAIMPLCSAPFDLTAVNARFESATGSPRYAYWEFLSAEDGGKVIDEHLNSFWAAMHGAQPGWMQRIYCVRDAMRNFVEQDGQTELLDYAKPGRGWKEDWMKMVKKGGGIESLLCWYRVMTENHHYKVEKTVPPEHVAITVPTLFVGCTKDEVCLPAMIENDEKAGLVPNLTVELLDCAHWCMMEKPFELAQALRRFLLAM
jgi:pimeloyl-ACP methyl ester carboxylesterase